MDLPYLFAPKGRSRRYWYYRRGGLRIAVAEPGGYRPDPETERTRFLAAYNRIHDSFDRPAPDGTRAGTLAHVVEAYRASPEYAQLAPRTQRDYRRHLDWWKADFGDLTASTMPREFVREIRDKYAATPRTANYKIAVLAIILNWAADRPSTFLLPANWRNPASRPKKLRTGPGHRPWEDWEIAAFRKKWKIGTRERTAFELLLNTGQRGQDVAAMTRQQYWRGSITLTQKKTGARLTIPASKALRQALDAYLRGHNHIAIFPGRKGAMGVDRFRHLMRDAYKAVPLTDVTNHGMRVTGATILLELGCDHGTIADITGHATLQEALHYTRQKRGAKAAVARLDEYGKRTASVNHGGAECKPSPPRRR